MVLLLCSYDVFQALTNSHCLLFPLCFIISNVIPDNLVEAAFRKVPISKDILNMKLGCDIFFF